MPPTLEHACFGADVVTRVQNRDCAILTRQLQQWLSSDVSLGASGTGNVNVITA
jgi:hypothetical protein